MLHLRRAGDWSLVGLDRSQIPESTLCTSVYFKFEVIESQLNCYHHKKMVKDGPVFAMGPKNLNGLFSRLLVKLIHTAQEQPNTLR